MLTTNTLDFTNKTFRLLIYSFTVEIENSIKYIGNSSYNLVLFILLYTLINDNHPYKKSIIFLMALGLVMAPVISINITNNVNV